MNIVLTGATGFIGRRLSSRLASENHAVRALGRKEWDVLKGPPPAEVLEGACGVVHLAGEPVAQRWNGEILRRIRASRVDATRSLVSTLGGLKTRPRVLVCASAVGYYGSRGDETLDESSAPGDDTLARICIDWEREAEAASSLQVRVVRLRFGIVLGKEGGALRQMLPAFRMGLGARLGSGRQWMSWIHIEDVVRLILFALAEDGVRGPMNAVSPNPVTNAQFTRELGLAVHRPAFLIAPEFALRLLFGEMAATMVESQRAVPRAALAAGFSFRYPEIASALENM